jgi:hypothetical protein
LYQTAWGTIGAAANTASSSVASLINVCTANANIGSATTTSPFVAAARAQIIAGQSAIANEIAPVLATAATVPAIAAAALAMNSKVTSEIGTATYSADLQSLMTMPPTGTDAANAQQDAQAYNTTVGNGATSSPLDSLSVSGSTLVDQMNLISANASTLQTTVCNPMSLLYMTGK